jgi:hypothetical protein
MGASTSGQSRTLKPITADPNEETGMTYLHHIRAPHQGCMKEHDDFLLYVHFLLLCCGEDSSDSGRCTNAGTLTTGILSLEVRQVQFIGMADPLLAHFDPREMSPGNFGPRKL